MFTHIRESSAWLSTILFLVILVSAYLEVISTVSAAVRGCVSAVTYMACFGCHVHIDCDAALIRPAFAWMCDCDSTCSNNTMVDTGRGVIYRSLKM